jgi:hypothetical protein
VATTGAEAPWAVSVKLFVVIVAGSIAAENVARTCASVATPVLPEAGCVDATLGPLVVVNVQLDAASAMPADDAIVPASDAVYTVPAVSAAVGVRVAVFDVPSYATVAPTGVVEPCAVSVKLVVVIVAGSIAVEKTAETVVASATPLAPDAGVVDETVGGAGVVAGAVVVKVHECALPSVVPAVSATELSSVAVYVVPFASAAPGVRVAVLVAASYATLAATGAAAPWAVSVKVELVIVAASIAPENVALTCASTAMSVAPAAGVVEVTVGPAATVVNCHVTALGSAMPSAALTVVSSLAV